MGGFDGITVLSLSQWGAVGIEGFGDDFCEGLESDAHGFTGAGAQGLVGEPVGGLGLDDERTALEMIEGERAVGEEFLVEFLLGVGVEDGDTGLSRFPSGIILDVEDESPCASEGDGEFAVGVSGELHAPLFGVVSFGGDVDGDLDHIEGRESEFAGGGGGRFLENGAGGVFDADGCATDSAF